MKKKLLGGLLVIAIAAVAAFNVNMNTEKSELSLLALANVEALAEGESSGAGKYNETRYKSEESEETLNGMKMSCLTNTTTCHGSGSAFCKQGISKKCIEKS